MIGHTISHYEILEKLGEGGMGVVHKALDTHLNRMVALKVLPRERVTDVERKQRFVQEAKAASSLNHSNIVTIHDIDSADGIDFIAMELVAGKTLDRWIPRHGLRLNEVLKYSVQIADALAAAHKAGIVHRDMKPNNVMINEQGLVKVRLRPGQTYRTHSAG
jgi:eukaryotic-like serine/threonine-protein kinase